MRHPFFLFSLLALLLPLAGCRPFVALGRNPEGADLQRMEAAPNYRQGEFQNRYRVPASPADTVSRSRRPRFLRLLRYLVSKPAYTRPQSELPSAITNLKGAQPAAHTVVWFGHSSFLLRTPTANLLFDPNFNSFAGPLADLIKAFPGTDAYSHRDLPAIDALIISHDHYDHLDYLAVKKLRKQTKRVIVPLGVGSHFRRWGYPAERITELNWNESTTLPDGTRITATPAHHRSNRGFAQRKTLWASFVIESNGKKIYFSGDTGYSPHFKDIGAQYGPFDLAMMECGQYNPNWSQSHMHPSQTARASIDIGAKMVLPIHWGRFAEALHPWNEPVNLLLQSADSLGVKVTVPFIGQPYSLGQPAQRLDWWNWQR